MLEENFEFSSRGLTVLHQFKGKSKSVVVPRSVDEIGAGCFYDCDISEIELEGWWLKRIGTGAFARCTLKSLKIPKSVEEIGDGCFCECESLSEVIFEEDSRLERIGKEAFKESALKRIRFPKSVKDIGEECFLACISLSEVTFEEGWNLRSIGELAFAGCPLKSLKIPKSVEEIGLLCFQFCESLSEVIFEEGSNLRRIGTGAFVKTGLTNFVVVKSVEILGWGDCDADIYGSWFGCFQDCKSLSGVTFEEGSNLKSIGGYAFYKSGLKSLIIPKSVENIDYGCFKDCKSLSGVTFEEGSNLKSIGRYAFNCSISSISLGQSDRERLSALLFGPETGLKAENVKINEIVSHQEIEVPEEKPLCEMVIDISDYEKIKKLGSGGFGKVFLCQNGDSSIAAKFINASDDRNQEIFEREIENLKSLSHPFIVSLRGFALPSPKNKNKFVIAMEYISGGSLESILADPPSWFDATSKIEIICGIALGMSFVHSKGIIHRDLKPANVLLDENHLPRVCDFGSSRLFSTDATITTSPGVTPVYEAPEVYDGEYTMKIDIYSFGVMLYELVTGNLAFRKLKPMQLMKHVGLGKREPIPDSVTPFSKSLIERCWSQDPESRPSFDEICALLRKNMHVIFAESDLDRILEFRMKYFR